MAKHRFSLCAAPGETIIQARSATASNPAPLLQGGHAPRRQLPRVHGGDQGRARARPSCCRAPTAGMEVSRVCQRSRVARAEDHRRDPRFRRRPGARFYTPDSKLVLGGRVLGVGQATVHPARTTPGLMSRTRRWPSISTPASSARAACAPAARSRSTTSSATRSAARSSKIVFDLDDPMGESTCVACGECVQACPTGALAPAKDAYLAPVDKTVASVCPYCGVGCQLTYHVKDNHIVRVEGRDGLANHERLCVKGRFGFDYVQHPQRLTKPLIRKPGAPKSADPVLNRPIRSRCSARSQLGRGATVATAAKSFPPSSAERARGSPGSARPRAPTRRRTSSRSWCAPASAPTTSTTARACATPRRSAVVLLEGWVRAQHRIRLDVIRPSTAPLIGGSNTGAGTTCGGDLVQECGCSTAASDRGRSAAARDGPGSPTHYLQFKPDTDVALRTADAHNRRGGAGRPAFVASRTDRFRGAPKRPSCRLQRGADGAGLDGHHCRAASVTWRCGMQARKAAITFWGMGISAAHGQVTDNAST